MDDRQEAVLEDLAKDAFGVFGPDPQRWPDIVEFNRSGYSDVNVRGIWTFESRTEFVNVPFRNLAETIAAENAYSPNSSGASA